VAALLRPTAAGFTALLIAAAASACEADDDADAGMTSAASTDTAGTGSATGATETETGTAATDTEGEAPLVLDPTAFPYERLSEYGFFKGELKALTPVRGVVPYTVRSPLFSDFAGKGRFIALPNPDAKITFDDGSGDPQKELWVFPEGTVIIKTFYLDLDRSSPAEDQVRVLETRLLVREGGDWTPYTYVWNDEETDAVLTKAGKILRHPVIEADGSEIEQVYVVPNVNQCANCHARTEGEEMQVHHMLGLVTLQLNYEVERDGAPVNQLDWLAAQGLFDGPLPAVDSLPTIVNPVGDASLHERARAYLHGNCGHCHRPGGQAGSSGLHLPYWELEPRQYGVCKPPAAAGAGAGGRFYDIVPGDPDASIVPFRMDSLDPDVKMPEIPTTLIHRDGVELVREWIAAMPPQSCD
jgi:uncharacterized repeat protein (TIGR03806 family)